MTHNDLDLKQGRCYSTAYKPRLDEQGVATRPVYATI
jgi:hypothetical protein